MQKERVSSRIFAADLAVLVTAASLALADAGVEMVDLVAATSLVSEECRLCAIVSNKKQGLALHCCWSAVNCSVDVLRFDIPSGALWKRGLTFLRRPSASILPKFQLSVFSNPKACKMKRFAGIITVSAKPR